MKTRFENMAQGLAQLMKPNKVEKRGTLRFHVINTDKVKLVIETALTHLDRYASDITVSINKRTSELHQLKESLEEQIAVCPWYKIKVKRGLIHELASCRFRIDELNKFSETLKQING